MLSVYSSIMLEFGVVRVLYKRDISL